MPGSPASRLTRWFPAIEVGRSYRREWLRADLVAGGVLTALLVPQGMAYAELAGLPAVTGLYTSVTALLAYALLGRSRIMMLASAVFHPIFSIFSVWRSTCAISVISCVVTAEGMGIMTAMVRSRSFRFGALSCATMNTFEEIGITKDPVAASRSSIASR